MEKHIYLSLQNTLAHRIRCHLLKILSEFTQKILGRDLLNSYPLIVEQITIPCQHLDAPFYGYRIAHISDIHIGTQINFARLNKVIDLVNKENPDLIVITGDLISDFTLDLFDELASALQALKSKDAVLAIRGNHDCWIEKNRFKDVLQQNGVIDISNAVYTINRGDAELHFVGLDDIRYKMDRLDEVMVTLPAKGAAILLAHEPDFADISSRTSRFDLQFSGHSHGGQLIFPIIGSPFLPPLGRKYPKGLYKIDQMHLYTNRGIGTASIPFRYRCPAEISIITLQNNIR